MSDIRTTRVSSFDETELAVHRLGAGRPVLMLHVGAVMGSTMVLVTNP